MTLLDVNVLLYAYNGRCFRTCGRPNMAEAFLHSPWERLALENKAGGPLMMDAALAAMALEHGAVLASTDRDFSRFPEIRWVNPIEP